MKFERTIENSQITKIKNPKIQNHIMNIVFRQ